MNLEPGRMLSHYRLVEKLGEGGMGVVWKAEDTTLDREVAIKILPDLFSQHPDRLARFEREAKLLASLNHANIAVIHGLHEETTAAGPMRFLAMELVQGEDLSQRLARGPLPLDEALNLSRQLAEALEAAHEQGVIHRDLKPANIQVTPDGQVKVLDFGLAKAFETDVASGEVSPTMSPTLTSAGTQAGMILGTAAYMSPEQAKGKMVDRRADIWAFGCVLYEMLSARQMFKGETVSETLAAVLLKDADWERLPSDTPGPIRRLLRRCLEKDPRSRLRDIGDARLSIEETMRGASAEDESVAQLATAVAPKRGAKQLLPWVGLALVTLAVGIGIGKSLQPTATESPLRKFRLAVDDADDTALSISPDGKSIVYKAGGALWVRDIDRLEPRQLPGAEPALKPFWSPDGEWLAYGVGTNLWKIPATGGEPSMIAEAPDRLDSAWGGAWGADGRIVFTTGDTGLMQVQARGGDVAPLHETDPETEVDYHDVSALPDGEGFVFVVHRNVEGSDGIDTLAIFADGEKRDILQNPEQRLSDPVYSPTGHILYRRQPTNPGIWALPFSLSELETTGEPFLVVPDGHQPSVSRDGTLVYLPRGGSRMTQLVWVNRAGQVEGPIGQQQEQSPFPVLSPDETRVAISAKENETNDIWLHDVARGTKTRLTFVEGWGPVWSPSGDHVVFNTGSSIAEFTLHITAADGTGEPRAVAKGIWAEFTPDGRELIYTGFAEGGNMNILRVALEEGAEPVPFLETASGEAWGRISPDATYLAYQSDESGRTEIYLKRFPSGEGKWQVSVDGGRWVRWSKDGDKLYFVEGEDFYEVEVAMKPSLTLGTPTKLFTRESLGWTLMFGWPPGFDVAADGRFVIAQAVNPDSGARDIVVVENWSVEF